MLRNIQKKEQGFILFITMIMLIIFAIIALSMYQQTTVLTRSVQIDSFKKEAQEFSLAALIEIEKDFPESVSLGSSLSGSAVYQVCEVDEVTGKPVDTRACEPIRTKELDSVIGNMTAGNELPRYWQNISGVPNYGNVESQAAYTIQQLGPDPDESKPVFYFRTTIVSKSLSSFDVISSIYVVPLEDK